MFYREYSSDFHATNQPPLMVQDYSYSSPRHNDRYGGDMSRTPGKKERMRRIRDDRDEATFGIPVDDMLSTEFDFQKNLALFDKQVPHRM